MAFGRAGGALPSKLRYIVLRYIVGRGTKLRYIVGWGTVKNHVLKFLKVKNSFVELLFNQEASG